MIVHITGTEDATKKIDFYHAFKSGAKSDGVTLTEGSYSAIPIGIINADGSIAKPIATQIAINPDSESINLDYDNTIPKESVNPSDIEQIVKDIETAISNGDETLKGDSGKEILDKAQAGVQTSPVVSEETKSEIAKTVTEAKTEADKAPVQSTPAAVTPAASGGSSEPAKRWIPEQGHNEPIYSTVTVVDSPAWTEKVVKHTWRFADGTIKYSYEEAEAYQIWLLVTYGNGVNNCYSEHDEISYINHPAVTHTETRQTGSRYVIDVPGHWE